MLILGGCASRTWTESTETTRPVGATTEAIETRPLADEFMRLATNVEEDGFTVNEDVSTNSDGKVEIELLTPALQCLKYEHDISIELWSYNTEEVVYSHVVKTDEARNIVREWSVQARLGGEVRLRRNAADLLDRLIDATPEKELRDQLEEIRSKVSIRLQWE